MRSAAFVLGAACGLLVLATVACGGADSPDDDPSVIASPATASPSASPTIGATASGTAGAPADTPTASSTPSAPPTPSVPRTASDAAVTIEAVPVQIRVLDNDAAAGGLAADTLRIERDPGHGNVQIADGVVTYTPDPGFSGQQDSFTYSVGGESGARSQSTTVTIDVQPPPRLAVSRERVDFGPLCIEFCDSAISVVLTNQGGGTLVVSDDGTAALNEHPSFSAISSCADVALRAAGANSCTIEVVFAPPSVGAQQADMRIEHTGVNGPINLTSQGMGVCPAPLQPVASDRLALLNERVGFGRNVTGGAGGCVYHVTSLDNAGPGTLREGLQSEGSRWVVFDVSGTIRLESVIKIAQNKTVDGRGSTIVIEDSGLEMDNASNIIIADIKLQHARQNSTGDLIRIWNGATRFWLHHLTLADAWDEYIDISKAPVGAEVRGTISWSRFEQGSQVNNNELAVLIGDQGGLTTNYEIFVTLHHNLFDGTRQRHPLVTGATIHSFNNVIRFRLAGIEVRCLGASICAQVVSERDVLDAGAAPPWNADAAVRIVDEGNHVRIVEPLLLNGASVSEADPVQAFVPGDSYGYRLDSTLGLEQLLQANTGPRL